ncbi:uncharacterized protein B0T15DRAFT_520466 [Chaetomium strumarium]|uniref:Uncharacterized protein n=1 Tax=Chaetomium strumarium TaxID=1170767 RepID=A0AAJ0M6V9_9PEZI|nr:hypothetical protein B0T15DRAFT_520466 [Chaetomium strumarium]
MAYKNKQSDCPTYLETGHHHIPNHSSLHSVYARANLGCRFTMCDWAINYYIYTTCYDPMYHFFRTSVDGSPKNSCPSAPHGRYIVQQGNCPLCLYGR